MWRFVKGLEVNDRLVSKVVKWAGTNVEDNNNMAVKKLIAIVQNFDSVGSIYQVF
jgi:hypothetical protein